jgi:hypothetical protein
MGNRDIKEKIIDRQINIRSTNISEAKSGISLYCETKTVSKIKAVAVKILAFWSAMPLNAVFFCTVVRNI